MSGGDWDILILGAGPAGISAALTARSRGRRAMVLSNDWRTSPLARAERVENYPGLAGQSGRALLQTMTDGLAAGDIPLVTGRATAAMPLGGGFMVSAGQAVYEAGALILAVGAARAAPLPGEEAFLGAGVSYCPTCDGMLYRGKNVAVVDLDGEGRQEAAFLESVGCAVEYFDRSRAGRYEIKGGQRVTALAADGVEYPAEGVFILRRTVAASALLPGLAAADGHITVDGDMKTSVPGVFAAGDCTGRPYQIARAVGQGNIAALSADSYLKERDK